MRKKLVLICDGDRAKVRTLSADFQLAGVNVETAFDLESAIVKMDERLPDLLCVDLDLSSPEGLSAFQMLATDQLAARLPAIALVRKLDETTMERTAGMCVYCVQRDAAPARWMECLLEETLDLGRGRVAKNSTDDDGFASAI